MAQQPMYQQPAAPSNMQYQNNPSNQQLNEKRPSSSHWTFGFWSCFSPIDIWFVIDRLYLKSVANLTSSCLGCWCPCILYGKTQARQDGDPNASGLGGMVKMSSSSYEDHTNKVQCCAYYCLLHIGKLEKSSTKHMLTLFQGVTVSYRPSHEGTCAKSLALKAAASEIGAERVAAREYTTRLDICCWLMFEFRCSGLVQEEKESLLRETGINPETKQQYQAPGPMMG